MKFLIFFLAALFLSSCGIGVGFAQTHGGTNLSYQVPVKDMKFEGEVSATVKGPSVFCIFPAYKPLMKQAMEKLNAESGIKNSKKALFNVRADVEDKFYIFWCTRHVTVSGDVYSIIKEGDEQAVERIAEENRKKTQKQQELEDKKYKEEFAKRQEEFKKQEEKQKQEDALKNTGFVNPEDRQKYLSTFWDALKKKDLAKIKDNVVYSLMDKPNVMKQEGFYFLGDVALLEKDYDKAETNYKKGLSIASQDQNNPDFSGLKFHLQQVGITLPELKESIQNIYNKLVK